MKTTRIYNEKFRRDKKIYTCFKQILIAFPPFVLTLHLRRFEFDGRQSVKKLNRAVPFPLRFTCFLPFAVGVEDAMKGNDTRIPDEFGDEKINEEECTRYYV